MCISSAAMAGSPAASGGADTVSFDDEFMQYCYKVEPCMLPHPHGWKMCPFVHPGEPVKRRHPSMHKGDMCPALKKGLPCAAGDDACPFAHSSFELWLHPKRFKTKMCRSGAACSRGICFFAHSEIELKQRQAMPKPTVIPGPAATAALAAAGAAAASRQAATAAAPAAVTATVPWAAMSAGLPASAVPQLGMRSPTAALQPQTACHMSAGSTAGKAGSGGCSPCPGGAAAAAVMPAAAQATEQLLLLQQQHRQFEQMRLLQEIDNKLQMLQLLQGAPAANASLAAVLPGTAPGLLGALAGGYSSSAQAADPLCAMRSSAAATTAALLGSPTGSTMLAPSWQQQQQVMMLGSSAHSSNNSSRSVSPGCAFASLPADNAGGSSSHLFPPSLPGVAVGPNQVGVPGCMNLMSCAPQCVPSSNWGGMNGTMLM